MALSRELLPRLAPDAPRFPSTASAPCSTVSPRRIHQPTALIGPQATEVRLELRLRAYADRPTSSAGGRGPCHPVAAPSTRPAVTLLPRHDEARPGIDRGVSFIRGHRSEWRRFVSCGGSVLSATASVACAVAKAASSDRAVVPSALFLAYANSSAASVRCSRAVMLRGSGPRITGLPSSDGDRTSWSPRLSAPGDTARNRCTATVLQPRSVPARLR